MQSSEYWQVNKETQMVLKNLDEEIEDCSREMLNGDLLLSPSLDREYSRAVGRHETLIHIKDLILKAYEVNNDPE